MEKDISEEYNYNKFIEEEYKSEKQFNLKNENIILDDKEQDDNLKKEKDILESMGFSKDLIKKYIKILIQIVCKKQ